MPLRLSGACAAYGSGTGLGQSHPNHDRWVTCSKVHHKMWLGYDRAIASFVALPFDGFHLFGDKANSALERFKESQLTAQSLGLSTTPASHPPPFTPSLAMVGATNPARSTNHNIKANRLPSLFRGRGWGSNRGRESQIQHGIQFPTPLAAAPSKPL